LLSFARGGRDVNYATVHLNSLLESIEFLCSPKFKEKNVTLKMEPQKYQHIMIQCRESEITQVLFNLLINSLQAVEQLRERWVELLCEDKDEMVKIVIKDSGPGISPEIRSKIFQPFFTTKEVGRGTGLGLSISIGLVEGHSGKIWVDDSEKNTTFIVQLPKKIY
jgi:signal transduction histidine kinase